MDQSLGVWTVLKNVACKHECRLTNNRKNILYVRWRSDENAFAIRRKTRSNKTKELTLKTALIFDAADGNNSSIKLYDSFIKKRRQMFQLLEKQKNSIRLEICLTATNYFRTQRIPAKNYVHLMCIKVVERHSIPRRDKIKLILNMCSRRDKWMSINALRRLGPRHFQTVEIRHAALIDCRSKFATFDEIPSRFLWQLFCSANRIDLWCVPAWWETAARALFISLITGRVRCNLFV